MSTTVAWILFALMLLPGLVLMVLSLAGKMDQKTDHG